MIWKKLFSVAHFLSHCSSGIGPAQASNVKWCDGVCVTKLTQHTKHTLLRELFGDSGMKLYEVNLAASSSSASWTRGRRMDVLALLQQL